ncbi:MAG: peroxiredoxin [Chloroflexota bacterium]
MSLNAGSAAPDFTLTDQNGAPLHLAERIRQHVIVLFFYPKDSSAGCTMEACAFRDSYEAFQDAGAEVIGVSGGTTETKQQFVRKNRLPFTLVTDADGAVAKAYGAEKQTGLMALAPQRATFVIDRDGMIRHRFESRFSMNAHVTEALKIVQTLAREAANSTKAR